MQDSKPLLRTATTSPSVLDWAANDPTHGHRPGLDGRPAPGPQVVGAALDVHKPTHTTRCSALEEVTDSEQGSPAHTKRAHPGESFCEGDQHVPSNIQRRGQQIKRVAHMLSAYCMPSRQGTTLDDAVCSERDLQLWRAASKGDAQGAREALEAGASPSCRLDQGHELALEYKNRKFSSQPLHVASLYRPDGCPEEGSRGAAEVVELLLQARANATAQATSELGDQCRKLQAIHLAAGAGNVGTIRLLLDAKVDPDAGANFEFQGEKHVHYQPIHDAAWFNRCSALKFLLDQNAKADARNNQGQTALHISAMQGHVQITQLLVEGADAAATEPECYEAESKRPQDLGRSLAQSKDRDGKTPLDLAVGRCRFPPSRLHLFTHRLDHLSRAATFKQVAHTCPTAAAALLRSGREQDQHCEVFRASQGHVDIDEEWRTSLKEGADQGDIDVHVLADLVKAAPQAAMDLLDALTDTPFVVSKEHHPLPVRAYIPNDWNSPCKLSYSYQHDVRWEWNPKEINNEFHGGMRWHHDLAPPDPKHGIEVETRVLKLKGVASLELLSGLSSTRDLRLFTKLMVHALLKLMWESFWMLFLLDLLHQAATVVVLSVWLHPWCKQLNDPVRRLLWCTVASQGLGECLILAATGWRCCSTLGVESFVRGTWLMKHRAVVGIVTVILALLSQEGYWPPSSTSSSAVLATTILLHWVHLLFELRAFQWTGQRLLPILKAVEPLGGMLVVLLFLLLGFVQAFWAMDRDRANEVTIWVVVNFLFAGNDFAGPEDLDNMGLDKRVFVIMLAILGLFVFLCCALNIFIAVLGELYDQEHERMVCTFMKERAKICFALFLRPDWPVLYRSEWSSASMMRLTRVAVLVALLATYGLLIYMSSVTAWIPALWAACCSMFAQVWLKGRIPSQWEQKYLWLCHDKHVDEDMFLIEDSGAVASHGRFGKMKRHMMDQGKAIAAECNASVGGIQGEVRDLRSSVEQALAEIRGLRQELLRHDELARSSMEDAGTLSQPAVSRCSGSGIGASEPGAATTSGLCSEGKPRRKRKPQARSKPAPSVDHVGQ